MVGLYGLEEMMQKSYSGTAVLVLASWLVLSHGGRADPSNLQQVDEILAACGLSSTGAATPVARDTVDQTVDRIATSVTAQLGMGNATWNTSNPRWKPIYDRIRADFAVGAATAAETTAAQAPAVAKQFTADLASSLQQSDADGMLIYLRSEQGKKYAAFLRGINPVVQQTAFRNAQAPPQRGLSSEQMQGFARMVALSTTYQTVVAGCRQNRDPSGCADMGLLFLGAISEKRGELDALDADYANDFPAFAAFSRSDVAQHFFTAFALVGKNAAGRPTPIREWLRDTQANHQAEWAALYRAAAEPTVGAGFAIQNVKSTRKDSVSAILLEGTVANVSSVPHEVPRLKAVVRSAAHQDLKEWTFTTEVSVLQPGATVNFRFELLDPPQGAADVALTFAR